MAFYVSQLAFKSKTFAVNSRKNVLSENMTFMEIIRKLSNYDFSQSKQDEK